MLNMLKLDWLGMKYFHIRIIMIPLISVCFMGFFNAMMIIPMTAFFMLSFSVYPFAVEEKGGLDNLYLTLPVTRRIIVDARMGLSLIMQFAGLVFGTVATVLFSVFLYGKTLVFDHTFKADFSTVFLLICASLLFYAIMNLSTFPLLFKLGYVKGRAFGFYIPIGAAVGIVYAFIMLNVFNERFRIWLSSAVDWVYNHVTLMSLMMLAAAAFILGVSYLLSQRLFAKREF